jgi:DNA-directed RNA polymerase specialized sigma24 family protein
LDSESFSSATLSEFYRYSLLLAGNPAKAEAALAAACGDVREQLGQLRSDTKRRAWMAMRIRQYFQCAGAGNGIPTPPRLLREGSGEDTEVLDIEAYILAHHFHLLPEPERSALALFYLELFDVHEIADLLQMQLEDLAATLGSARKRLHESLKQGEAAVPSYSTA